MNTKTILAVVIGLVVGFGAGYTTHSSPSTPTMRAGFTGQNNGTFTSMRGGGAGGGFLNGTVAAITNGSLTLNTRDGSSHVVLITANTTVSKSVSGNPSDVKIGSTVMISGTTNSDGSVLANLIQLRPATTTTP